MPANAKKGPGGGRFYVWPKTGERFWSVTTIIDGALPKEALIHWAANKTAEAAIEKIATVQALLQSDRDATAAAREADPDAKPVTDGRKQAYEMLRKARYESSGTGKDIGTAVHNVAEAWVLGSELPEWDDEVEVYVEAFLNFLQEVQPEFVATEATVYNRTQAYAGTFDAIIRVRREILLAGGWVDDDYPDDTGLLLADYKTTNRGRQGHGIYSEVGLQLAAYRHAEFVGLDNGVEEPLPETVGAAAVWLGFKEKKDGTQVPEYKLVPVRADDDVFRAFLFARENFRWVQELSREVVDKPVKVPALEAAKPEAVSA